MTENAAPALEPAPVEVVWNLREPPLEPAAVLARGDVALTLARRVLDRFSDNEGSRDAAEPSTLPWTGIVGLVPDIAEPLLVLLGNELPWVEGVSYFAVDPRAPSILLPTWLAPSVPVELLQRIVTLRGLTAPVLMVPPIFGGGGLLIPAGKARLVDIERLRSWLKKHDSGVGGGA